MPTSGGRRGSSTPACPFCKPLARLTVGEETGVDRRGGMCYHEALSLVRPEQSHKNYNQHIKVFLNVAKATSLPI